MRRPAGPARAGRAAAGPAAAGLLAGAGSAALAGRGRGRLADAGAAAPRRVGGRSCRACWPESWWLRSSLAVAWLAGPARRAPAGWRPRLARRLPTPAGAGAGRPTEGGRRTDERGGREASHGERRGDADDGWRGTVALVLASSTGGVGQHVASLARGLVAAGAAVTVCGPAATEEQFGFTGAGRPFVPVEIPASPDPGDARAVAALRRALAAGRSTWCTPTGCAPAWSPRSPGPPPRWWSPGTTRCSPRACAGGRPGWSSGSWPGPPGVTLGASADLVERAAALGRRRRPARPRSPRRPAARRAARRAAVRAEFGVAPDQPLILSVGRLHPQKRYDVLVDAAARWRELRPGRRSW